MERWRLEWFEGSANVDRCYVVTEHAKTKREAVEKSRQILRDYSHQMPETPCVEAFPEIEIDDTIERAKAWVKAPVRTFPGCWEWQPNPEYDPFSVRKINGRFRILRLLK